MKAATRKAAQGYRPIQLCRQGGFYILEHRRVFVLVDSLFTQLFRHECGDSIIGVIYVVRTIKVCYEVRCLVAVATPPSATVRFKRNIFQR